MNYYSLNNKQHRANFHEALLQGLAPDKGLYFPETITPLPQTFFDTIETLSNQEIAYQVIAPFVGSAIPESNLRHIIDATLQFDFPLVEVEPGIYSLELFHGPTMAFKDVGAKFMAQCLAYFAQNNTDRHERQNATVLVATSGDTGGAVANGFLGTPRVDVVILYPKGKVSDIQELQLTTLGQNIRALAVDGVFDDCQDMVKRAFLDPDLSHKNLTSANSINIARWLPQMFYFFIAYKSLKKCHKPITISCPSGNFGNICAGILAKRLGLPIKHFVAACNSNDTVPRFMTSGHYQPQNSVATISNAMDVGNPSNFIRIQELYHLNNVAQPALTAFKVDFSAQSFTDPQTKEAMLDLYQTSGYIADPHGAVAYLGLKGQNLSTNEVGVFLETAHPVKFKDIVEPTLGTILTIPAQIQAVLGKNKMCTNIKTYEELKAFLS